MSGIAFEKHKGHRILILDFSGLDDSGLARTLIAEAKEIVANEPEKSLLTLTDVTDVVFDQPLAQATWEMARHNKPFVKAAAIVGLSGERQQVLLDLVSHRTGRDFAIFDTRAEAKDWLVEQAS